MKRTLFIVVACSGTLSFSSLSSAAAPRVDNSYLGDYSRKNDLIKAQGAVQTRPTRYGSRWDASSRGWKLERLEWLGHAIPTNEADREIYLQTLWPEAINLSQDQNVLRPICKAYTDAYIDDLMIDLDEGYCAAQAIPMAPFVHYLWHFWREENSDFPSAKKIANYELSDLFHYDEIGDDDGEETDNEGMEGEL